MACSHENVTWPQSGWQSCVDCGARRLYTVIGNEPGPWETEPEVETKDDRYEKSPKGEL